MDGFSYVLSFIEGILTFVSPCLLPLLPVYLFYLAGVSRENNSSDSVNKGRLIANSIGFVIGFTIIFVLLGATATSLGSFLKNHLDTIRILSGLVMIVFGLNFIGILRLDFLNFEKRMEYNVKELKFFSSIIFGMVFAFGWSPCVGQYLAVAFSMAGTAETILEGALLLLVYSLGLGIPFILSAVIYESVKESFRKLRKYSRLISIISGIVLIIAGLVYTDVYSLIFNKPVLKP